MDYGGNFPFYDASGFEGIDPNPNMNESLNYPSDTGNFVIETGKINVPITVFRLIVCALGIIGNLLVIFVILVLAEYRKAVTHWYVLQLAIADCLFLMTLPFRVVEDIDNAWTFPSWLCKAKETILFINYYSSVLFLTVMSIDRYIAVCHGFSGFLQRFRTPFAAMVVTIAIWGISLCLSIPVMLYSGVYGVDPHCKCQYEFPVPFNPVANCLKEGYEPNTTKYDECVTFQKKTGDGESGSCTKELVIPSFGGNEEIELGFNFEDFFNNYDGGSGFYEMLETTPSPDVQESAMQNENVLHLGCHYYEHGDGFKAFLIFNFVVMFIIPLVVMTLCYTFIVIRLKNTRIQSDNNDGQNTSTSGGGLPSNSGRKKRSKSAASVKDNRNRTRVTVMCASLVIFFVICWLPFHSVHLAKIQGMRGKPAFCGLIASVASLIAYINSAINPYLYNFVGTRFGKRLRSAASAVQNSVKKRTASMSGSVRYYNRRRNTDGGSSSQAATVTTKIFKGKNSEMRTMGNMSTNGVLDEDSKFVAEEQALFSGEEKASKDPGIPASPTYMPPSYESFNP